jgi:hypothetical protein
MATLEQRVQEGDLARQVLDNEVFARAFDTIEQEHIEAWKNSPARDREGRESLWTTVKLLHKLRGTLEAAMTDGQLARIEMERQAEMLAQERSAGLNTAGWS